MALTFNQVPANCSIRFLAGDDVKMPFQICQPVTANGITSNVPVNITGYTFETGIATTSGTFTGNVDILSLANGSIAANYTDSVTSAISRGCWYWYLKMTDTSAYTRTILHGNAEVSINGST